MEIIPQVPLRKQPGPPSTDLLEFSSSGCSAHSSKKNKTFIVHQVGSKGKNQRLYFITLPHLSIPLFAQLLLLLFGQEPHGHAQQVVVVRSTGVLLLCLLLVFTLSLLFVLRANTLVTSQMETDNFTPESLMVLSVLPSPETVSRL